MQESTQKFTKPLHGKKCPGASGMLASGLGVYRFVMIGKISRAQHQLVRLAPPQSGGADIDDCVRAVTLGICFCAIYFLCEDRFQTNRPLLHTLCIVPDICPSVCIIIIQIQKLIHSFFAVMCDDHHIQNGLCLIKQNGNGICIMNQQILVLQ